MVRIVAVAVFTAVGACGMPARAQAPGAAVQVPDPGYRPVVGDAAEITADGVPAADGRAALDMFVGSRERGDRVGMEKLTNLADVVTLNRKTAVRITRVYATPRAVPADPLRGFTMGEYRKAMREARARDGDHPAGYPIEVQVIDGPNAGKTLVVEAEHVGRLIWRKAADATTSNPALLYSNPPKKKARPVPKSAPPRPVDPATQAAASVQTGKNLRFAGNRPAAVESFRKAITLAPESPAAAEARAVLKVMGVE